MRQGSVGLIRHDRPSLDRILKPLWCVEECKQPVAWLETPLLCIAWLEPRQRCLFQQEIDVEIGMSVFHGHKGKRVRNDRVARANLEKLHRCAGPTEAENFSFVPQRGCNALWRPGRAGSGYVEQHPSWISGAAGPVRALAPDLFRPGREPSLGGSDAVLPAAKPDGNADYVEILTLPAFLPDSSTALEAMAEGKSFRLKDTGPRLNPSETACHECGLVS